MPRKTTLFALALASLAAIAPGSGAFAQSKPSIGIAMPHYDAINAVEYSIEELIENNTIRIK